MVTTCHVSLTKSWRLKIQPLNLITQVALFTLWIPLIKLYLCVSQHKTCINTVSFEIIRAFLSLQYLISLLWRSYPDIVYELSLLCFFFSSFLYEQVLEVRWTFYEVLHLVQMVWENQSQRSILSPKEESRRLYLS